MSWNVTFVKQKIQYAMIKQFWLLSNYSMPSIRDDYLPG